MRPITPKTPRMRERHCVASEPNLTDDRPDGQKAGWQRLDGKRVDGKRLRDEKQVRITHGLRSRKRNISNHDLLVLLRLRFKTDLHEDRQEQLT